MFIFGISPNILLSFVYKKEKDGKNMSIIKLERKQRIIYEEKANIIALVSFVVFLRSSDVKLRNRDKLCDE